MKLRGEKGLTLVELIISIAIMGILAASSIPLFSSTLEIYRSGTDESRLYHQGLTTMSQLARGVKSSTLLLIPNAHKPARNILAFSGRFNEDNDFYFADPLFPKIDEDPHESEGGGIAGVDDDGDGLIDEGDAFDDDEDGSIDEEFFDSIDNDGDGNVDEDCSPDRSGDGEPGIIGMDDDNDGGADEGNTTDDDEDGQQKEDSFNAVIYSYDNGTNTLTETIPHTGQSTVFATRVSFFQVTYEAPERVLIELTLTGDDGESIVLSEYVCPRNTYQRTGKRVR